MVRFPAFARQPPAGDPGAAPRLDELLRELRRGERDAFVRYYRLFCAPAYDFSRRLLLDGDAAVAATREAFATAFRRVILDDGVTDLSVLTYGCALEACEERIGEWGTPAGVHRAPASPGAGAIVVEALESLEPRRRAALLLHDVQGLHVAQLAAVLGLTGEAAGAFLYRAREEFRRSFAAGSPALSGGPCRQAEQAMVGAVGLGLDEDDLVRLRLHAAYCGPCRNALRALGTAPAGLAAFLKQAQPPQALETEPVFGGAAGVLAAVPAVARPALLARVWRPGRRVVRSRLTAYLLAAAFLALAVGLGVQMQGMRPSVFFQSVGPAIRLVTGAAGETSHGRSDEAQKSTSGTVSPSPPAGSQPTSAPSPLVKAPSGGLPTGAATVAPREAGMPSLAASETLSYDLAAGLPPSEEGAALSASRSSDAKAHPAKETGKNKRSAAKARSTSESKRHGSASGEGHAAVTSHGKAHAAHATHASHRKARPATRAHKAHAAKPAGRHKDAGKHKGHQKGS